MTAASSTVLLRCERCDEENVSSLFYRGRGQHRCPCGGRYVLAPESPERRHGGDRRRKRVPAIWPDWRTGPDRRETG